jgi:hypothetical protein
MSAMIVARDWKGKRELGPFRQTGTAPALGADQRE